MLWLFLGIGDNGTLYAFRYIDPGPWQETALPGGVTVLSFTLTGGPTRFDAYAVGTDQAAYHWHSTNGGADWNGPEHIGGKFKSGLAAYGPGTLT